MTYVSMTCWISGSMNEEMNNDEWILKLPRDKHYEAKVSFIYHNGLTKELRDLLNKEQMLLFNQTCFRHILQLPKLQNSGALIHSLLLREVVNPNVEDGSMRFRVGGQNLEFSRRDVALILGLPMDLHVFPGNVGSRGNRLKKKYFDGVVKVNFTSMMDAIRSCEDDEDKVKLACVCLLEYFLLGKDKSSTAVDDSHLDLVDDLDEFNKYPWGRDIHLRTFKYLQKAVTPHCVKKQEKKVRSKNCSRKKLQQYTLLGFPYILQVWAYEVIHQVRDNFAQRTTVVEAPRILHWSCNRWESYKELNDLVFGLEEVVTSPLSPSAWELTQLRYLKVDSDDSDDMDVDDEEEGLDQSVGADDYENWADGNEQNAYTDGQEDMEIQNYLPSDKVVAFEKLREAYRELEAKYQVLEARFEQQPSVVDHHQLILLCVELSSAQRKLKPNVPGIPITQQVEKCEFGGDVHESVSESFDSANQFELRSRELLSDDGETPVGPRVEKCKEGMQVDETLGDLTHNDGDQLERELTESIPDDGQRQLDPVVEMICENHPEPDIVAVNNVDKDLYDDICNMLSTHNYKRGPKISEDIRLMVSSLPLSIKRGIRPTKKTPSVLSPFTSSKYQRKNIQVVYDPFKEVPKEDELKFMCFCYEWISGISTNASSLGVGKGDIVFFRDLYCKDHWLSDYNMDAWLFHLRQRKKLFPNLFGGRWITTDCQFIE